LADGYHISSEYGLVELLDENNNPVKENNKVGRIVATGFHNYVMPFIRYETGDYGVYCDENCPCGRGLPLIKKIMGRIQELLVTKRNTIISATSLNMHDDLFAKLLKYQFFQERPGYVEIRAVTKDGFTEKEAARIISTMQSVSSNLIDFSFRIVKDVQTTKTGKVPVVVQQIPLNQYKSMCFDY